MQTKKSARQVNVTRNSSRSLSRGAPVMISLAALALGCAFEAANPEESVEVLGTQSEALGQLTDIPMTGTSHSAFTQLDTEIRRFMNDRSIGSTVIAVSKNGKLVHSRGYGYLKGPPSPSSATPDDAFLGGTKTHPSTAMRIGSNTKAFVAAALREKLKQLLAAQGRPATDEYLENLYVLSDSIEMVSPRIKQKLWAATDANCNVPNGWRRIQLKHLLGHTAGLDDAVDVTSQLANMRGIDSAAEASAEQAKTGAPLAARQTLTTKYGENAYFMRPTTSEETFFGQSPCLQSEPGAVNKYSNRGYGVLAYILEHVSKKRLAALEGDNESHVGSALDDFNQQHLGFSVGARSAFGIYYNQASVAERDPAEPQYRAWSATSATYYPLRNDPKRPFCLLSNGTCDFSKHQGLSTTFNWAFSQAKVPLSYNGAALGPGPGRLAAEAPLYLKFLNNYWVSGDGNTPIIGEPRALTVSTANRSHYGSMEGTLSWAAQFVGKASTLEVPSVNSRSGRYAFDLPPYAVSCTIPKGVDVILNINQTRDKACTDMEENGGGAGDSSGASVSYSCGTFYGYLSHIVAKELCEVDWMKVGTLDVSN
jgi:hypothetical protein